MEDLKFKYWLPKLKQMSAPVGLITFAYVLNDMSRDMKGLISLQFSTLKDRAGKDIFKGDILLEEWPDENEPNGVALIYYEVVFHKGSFCWVGENTGELFSFMDIDISSDCAIVGNIYEHPKLVKKLYGGKAYVPNS